MISSEELKVISNTITFVKATLKDAEGGHDWFHIQRVLNTAITISKREQANEFVVQLGALLHDIADSKFHKGDESVGPKVAREFLFSQNVDSSVIEHVVNIINAVSYKGGYNSSTFNSLELQVVQDADRLDALGAIGVARTFNYGGFKNRTLYDPDIKPNLNMSKEEYKASTAPTLNHFYEKLLLLKDLMNTKTGKHLAEKRHRFMELYLDQFLNEWEGHL
jgi:uncharacterized protein